MEQKKRDNIRALSDDYEIINSFNLIKSGLSRKYLKVKHKYCNNIYEIRADSIPSLNKKCPKCCGSYEKSFAYHIEVELGEPLEKYWDFEKNVVNPYHISKNKNYKNSKGENWKVWIKCIEKDYHESYEISCADFISGYRCGYCASKKVHTLDSFGQYLKTNNILDLWSNKNTLDPYTISKSSSKKVWMLCDNVDYHNDDGGYEISCANFINGKRCSYCKSMYKVHIKDSFGYKYPDKAKCWHEDNKKSPYEVALSSHRKYKFICDKCGCIWNAKLYNISLSGTWCPECNISKGEKYIQEWLKENNISYERQKTYNGLIGVNNGMLSYDFFLPNHNILIEYQGEFHDGNNLLQTKSDLKRQQEHDRRKREYAKDKGTKLLEIWYWDFENIDEILRKELN